MGDILRADAHCPPRAERVGSWRVSTESRSHLVAALPDGDRVASPCRRDAEARGASMPKRPRFARTPRQLSAKTRQSNEAAASGVRKRDVLAGARSRGRSAVERVAEAVAGARIMFRPFKSLGVVDFPGMRHHPIPCHAASSRCRSPPGRPLGYGGGERTHGAARLGRRGRDHLAGLPLSKRRADCRWGGEPSVVGAACRSLSEQSLSGRRASCGRSDTPTTKR